MDFLWGIYPGWRIKVFHLGIKQCSAFLFLTCKGSLLPLIKQGGPLDRLAEKIILASLRYFFAKPCTIRAKDKRMHIRKEIPALPKPGMFNHKMKKTMIQTKNKYCKETFIRLNYWYDRMHGLVREDIEKVNAMVEHIEKTRSDRYPRTGDSLFLISGYGERSRPFFVDAVYGDNIVLRNFSRVPFVSRDKKGIKCDMHGGECVLVKAGDVRFKAWTTARENCPENLRKLCRRLSKR